MSRETAVPGSDDSQQPKGNPNSEEKTCREGAKKRRRTKKALTVADKNHLHL
jgi:hypothetical protein